MILKASIYELTHICPVTDTGSDCAELIWRSDFYEDHPADRIHFAETETRQWLCVMLQTYEHFFYSTNLIQTQQFYK